MTDTDTETEGEREAENRGPKTKTDVAQSSVNCRHSEDTQRDPVGQTGRDRQEEAERATWDRTSAAGVGNVPKESSPGSGRDRLGEEIPDGREWDPGAGDSVDPSPSPPPNLPPGGGWAEGPEGQWGRVPSTGLGGPHLLCSLQGEHGGAGLDLPQLQPPPLFIPWPSPLGG